MSAGRARPRTPGKHGPALAATEGTGTLIAAHGRHYLVEVDGAQAPDGAPLRLNCVLRARGRDAAVGDRVAVRDTGSGTGLIERIIDRRNLVRRSRGQREKLLAANVDTTAVVVAPSPPMYEELLARVLIGATHAGTGVHIIATKADHGIEGRNGRHGADDGEAVAQRAAFDARMAIYRALGVPVTNVSAARDAPGLREALLPWMRGRTTLLIGQSGMGKSTLVNTLVPNADVRTQAISEALASGRHTTTLTRAFRLPAAEDDDSDGDGPRTNPGLLIDSPGLQHFGLDHVSLSEAMHAMPDLAALHGRCRFNNCLHLDEPGCVVRDAIDPQRLRLWQRLASELSVVASGWT